MKSTPKILLIILITFGLYYFLDELYFRDVRTWLFGMTDQMGISHNLTYLLSGIPLFIGAAIVNRKSSFLQNLGLKGSILEGLAFALICTLPLFIGFKIVFDFNTEIKLDTILISVLAAGLFEELYFRGFLFGLIFRYTKIGFIPAVIFGAIYFGMLHLYQSNDTGELIGIFLITFLGGILFAWVYAEWNYNIWVPIFLHMFMNLAWELFSVSDNALGGIYANVFRGICIALIIILTIIYKKKKGLPLEVNKRTLLMKKEES